MDGITVEWKGPEMMPFVSVVARRGGESTGNEFRIVFSVVERRALSRAHLFV